MVDLRHTSHSLSSLEASARDKERLVKLPITFASLCLILVAVPGRAEDASLPLRYLPPGTILDCPMPSLPSAPSTPSTPSPPSPPADQGQPPASQPGQAQPATPSSPTDAFAQAPEGGTQPAASLSPNLYGDAFGGSPFRIVIPRSPILIPGTPGT